MEMKIISYFSNEKDIHNALPGITLHCHLIRSFATVTKSTNRPLYLTGALSREWLLAYPDA